MIKIFFPLDVRERPEDYPELIDIFKTLAQKAFGQGSTLAAIHCLADGTEERFVMDSEEKYLDFLLAADFYRYDFSADSEVLKTAFAYQQLTDRQRHRILEIMDVPVCPYCNMNFTVKLQKNGQTVSTADIDHFYPKSRYPQYALCLYNMIPACQVCNSRMKLDQEMTVKTHLYPHRDSLENLADFRIENLANYRADPEAVPKVKLEIRPEKAGTEEAKKVINSEKLFHLDARYESLDSYAKKLTDRAEIYTEHYTEELGRNFRKIFGGVSIRDLAFGPEEAEQEFGRESLGKLKRDLLRQLNVYDSED